MEIKRFDIPGTYELPENFKVLVSTRDHAWILLDKREPLVTQELQHLYFQLAPFPDFLQEFRMPRGSRLLGSEHGIIRTLSDPRKQKVRRGVSISTDQCLVPQGGEYFSSFVQSDVLFHVFDFGER